MRGMLTFNLPKEKTEFELASKASALHDILADFDRHLRGVIKYPPDVPEKDRAKLSIQIEIYEKLRAYIWELLNEEGIDLYRE